MKRISLFLLILSSCSLVKDEIRLGSKWEKISENQFPLRRNFGTAVVDGNIIIIGGYIQNGSRDELANDVWISKDEGRTWKKIKENTSSPTETFTKRQKFGTIAVGKNIYIIGGYSETGSHLNDIWKSSDFGETWIEVANYASFSPRYGHKTVVIGNEIYVIGGYDGRQYFNEVWKSIDLGKTWTQMTGVPFKNREGFGAINYKSEILLIGGHNREILTDVWRSEQQRKRWYKQPNAPFELFEQEIVEVEKDLFVVEQDHVWKSIDEGMTWEKVVFEAPFGERTGYGMVNIGRKLILFGGINPSSKKYLNDVWVSTY
ncbi:MAG: Kelch repeat-containing protein [Brevinemataceae bacterium]